MPHLENAGCILYWGYSSNNSLLAHATATTAAVALGFIGPAGRREPLA